MKIHYRQLAVATSGVILTVGLCSLIYRSQHLLINPIEPPPQNGLLPQHQTLILPQPDLPSKLKQPHHGLVGGKDSTSKQPNDLAEQGRSTLPNHQNSDITARTEKPTLPSPAPTSTHASSKHTAKPVKQIHSSTASKSHPDVPAVAAKTGLTGIKPESIPTKTVLGYAPNYASTRAITALKQNASAFCEIADWSYSVNAQGIVAGTPQGALDNLGHSENTHVYASVNNGYKKDIMASILTNSAKMHTFVKMMTQIAVNHDYYGVNLDLENVPSEDRTQFSKLVAELADKLHQQNKLLTVTVPALTNGSSGYDLKNLANASDALVIMAYDYTYVTQPPGPIAPIPWVEQVLTYNVKQASPAKLILGLGVYGYNWSPSGNGALTETTADEQMTTAGVTAHWEAQAGTEWYAYTDSEGHQHTVYFENAKSIKLELKLAKSHGLRGVAIWPMGGEDEAVNKALAQYLH